MFSTNMNIRIYDESYIQIQRNTTILDLFQRREVLWEQFFCASLNTRWPNRPWCHPWAWQLFRWNSWSRPGLYLIFPVAERQQSAVAMWLEEAKPWFKFKKKHKIIKNLMKKNYDNFSLHYLGHPINCHN